MGKASLRCAVIALGIALCGTAVAENYNPLSGPSKDGAEAPAEQCEAEHHDGVGSGATDSSQHKLEKVVPAEPIYTEMKLSEEYSVSLFACHIPQKSVKLLSAEPRKLHGRDVSILLGDRDYNDRADMSLVFDVNAQGEIATFPHYYLYDNDFDGIPDKAYRDVNGNGVCQEMEEIPVNYLMDKGKDI